MLKTPSTSLLSLFNDVQSWNAHCPIDAVSSGIVMLPTFDTPLNALLGIVKSSVIMMLVNSEGIVPNT